MAKSDITKRPKRNGRDILHTLTRAGFSVVPPANELLSLVITPSLEKRRDKWIESIAEGLENLTKKFEGFKIEDLCEKEAFISTFMQASQLAIRNHQREKLEALKNAVLNTTLPNAPEENLQLMFLNFVESFTPLHLRILSFFNNGKKVAGAVREKVRGNNREVWLDFKNTFSRIENIQGFFDQVIIDLYARGLSQLESTDNYARIYKAGTGTKELTTRLGKMFLKFITSPIKSEE